jgi:hypothetical protein
MCRASHAEQEARNDDTQRVITQLLTLEHCWSISTGSCFTTLLTALISCRSTTICLRAWKNCCDHSTSRIMRSWWKVSKCGWAPRRHTFLAQVYKLIPRYKCLNSAGGYGEKLLKYVFFPIAGFVYSLPEVTFRTILVRAPNILEVTNINGSTARCHIKWTQVLMLTSLVILIWVNILHL